MTAEHRPPAGQPANDTARPASHEDAARSAALRDAAWQQLRLAGTGPDSAVDLAETALALAVLGQTPTGPDGLAPYRRHLAEISRELTASVNSQGAPPDLNGRAALLSHVLHTVMGYQGDLDTYDDLRNASLTAVIQRRRGLPVALGILYLHAARSQGWVAEGLAFPGHFLIRIEQNGSRLILDPFHDGRVLQTPELRTLLKQVAGPETEMAAAHTVAVGNRDVLLRLQNNLKLRYLRDDRPDLAVAVLEPMLLLVPEQPSLWREIGLLQAHLGNLGSAIRSLDKFMTLGQQGGAPADLLQETAALISQLRRRLN
jgi:regulator of sirC expression with transglutaminase-like and TPR domain